MGQTYEIHLVTTDGESTFHPVISESVVDAMARARALLSESRAARAEIKMAGELLCTIE